MCDNTRRECQKLKVSKFSGNKFVRPKGTLKLAKQWNRLAGRPAAMVLEATHILRREVIKKKNLLKGFSQTQRVLDRTL